MSQLLKVQHMFLGIPEGGERERRAEEISEVMKELSKMNVRNQSTHPGSSQNTNQVK